MPVYLRWNTLFKDSSDLLKLQISSLKYFSNKAYSIVGDGNYVLALLKLIQDSHGNYPTKIYIRNTNASLPQDLLENEDYISAITDDYLILGTNLFQLEMLERLRGIVPNTTKFVDVLAGIGHADTADYFMQSVPKNEQYLFFYTVNPVINIEDYLQGFFNCLESQSIKVVVRHPLQIVEDTDLLNAAGVIVWNGSMRVHSPIINKCRSLHIAVTYAECGFFPQKQFFYLDKCGVNAKSQLNQDDLCWVTENEVSMLAMARSHYQVQHQVEQGNYILVPLQVPSDSNIINHSRFKNGMQEFINYIEALYPDEQLWFKPHPKDRFKDNYHYTHGRTVEGDLNALIAGAKKIHGINSSVLYEAALMGKEVVVEGDCLLKRHEGNTEKLLAAMLTRQFNIADKSFSQEKIDRFSHLNIN
jgi:capsule polysaccharide export protein KpsC/LpsZ